MIKPSGPVSYRLMWVLISFSTQSSAGTVRADAFVLSSASIPPGPVGRLIRVQGFTGITCGSASNACCIIARRTA